jgi:hypothetical protein
MNASEANGLVSHNPARDPRHSDHSSPETAAAQSRIGPEAFTG